MREWHGNSPTRPNLKGHALPKCCPHCGKPPTRYIHVVRRDRATEEVIDCFDVAIYEVSVPSGGGLAAADVATVVFPGSS